MKSILKVIICCSMFGCQPYEEPELYGPSGSRWVGGVDGGVYVYIEDDLNSNDRIYQGVIYFDYDKTLWYEGRFEYSKDKVLDFDNYQLYSGWDGERLYLKDNSYLKVIDAMPQL